MVNATVSPDASPLSLEAVTAAWRARGGLRLPSVEQQQAAREAHYDAVCPVLAIIKFDRGGLIVSKPGTTCDALVSHGAITQVELVSPFGERRDDRPNGRSIFYPTWRCSIAPCVQKRLRHLGIL